MTYSKLAFLSFNCWKNLFLVSIFSTVALFSAIACDNSTVVISSAIDNGNGTTTYTLDLFTDLGSLDATFYGFLLEFQSSNGTPVVSGFPATLDNSDLTTGFYSETLIGLTGNDVNSQAGDSDWNPYMNSDNVLSYEWGGFGGAASNDFSLTLQVTVTGCVETIMYYGHVNSGSGSCQPTVNTGVSCACTATISPSATSVCQGATSNLSSGIAGTQGTNPAYSWTSTDFTITSPSSSSATINIPGAQTANTYTITLTYTDDNGCNLVETTDFNVSVCCSDDVGNTTGSITGDGSSPATNEYVLCDGDDVSFTTVGADPSVDYAIYNCAPTGDDPATDACYTTFWFEQLNSMTETSAGDNSPVLLFLDGEGVSHTDNTVWWVPVSTDATGNYDVSCFDMDFTNNSFKVTYLNAITTSETVDCPAGSVTVTISGGHPEFFSGDYTLTNTGDGTLSATTISTNGGSVVITGLADGETPSFDIEDDNGCPETYTGTTLNCTCPASVGTLTITGATSVGATEYDLDNGGTINFSTSGEDDNGGALTFGYAAFDCDPGLPFSVAELSDLNNHACYIGSDYGVTTSDNNAGGSSGSLFNNDPVWFVPYTSDVANSPDNNGDGCYAIGDAIQVNYLDPVCGDCATPTCPIAGVPTFDDRADGYFGGPDADCNILGAALTNTTYVTYHTATADANGNLGIVQQADDGGCATRTAVIRATSGGICTGGDIAPSIANANGLGSGFNPEWYGLTPNADYVVIITITVPGGCFYGQGCTVFYGIPTSCTASVGSLTVTGATSVSTTEYDLADGGTINFSTTGEDENGGALTFGYAVFDCDPGLPFSAAELSDLNNHSCYLGSDYGTTTSDDNAGGTSLTFIGLDPVWVVPYTSDVANSPDNDGDGCYAIGDAIQINYLDPGCGDCSTPTCPIAGVPTFDDRTDGYFGGPDADCNILGSPITNTTYVTYHTATADAYGNLGIVQQADDGGCATRAAVIRATSGGICTGGDIAPSVANANGLGSGFNPEWYGLTPNADYVVIITITVPSGCFYGQGCTVFYGLPCAVTASATSIDVSCLGGNDGTATGSMAGGVTPFTYNWDNGQTVATATGLSTGNYNVTITDGGGCEASTSATVSSPTAVSATLSTTDATCGAANGTATVTSSGGTGSGYTYSWFNGATTTTISALNAGAISVTVSDANGCVGQTNGFINNPVPSITVSPNQTLNCNGDNDGTASVSITGAATPVTYNWSNGDNSASISVLVAGTYTVTVQDNNGCTQFGATTISEPAALSITHVIQFVSCFNGSDGSIALTISGGTAPFNYNWNNGQAGATATGLEAGSYFTTVTDANGCSITQAFSGANSIFEPSQLTTDIAVTDATCGGANGTATASSTGGTGTTTYLWSTGSTSNTTSGLTAGNISVTATDANGCTASDADFVNNPLPSITVSAPNQLSCFGDSDGSLSVAAGGGSTPYIYTWSNGNNSAALNGLTAGTYTVTVADNNGCTQFGTTSVTEPAQISVVATIQNPSCSGLADGQIDLLVSGGTSGYSYAWSNGSATATVSALATNTYDYTVTDNNGCTISNSETVDDPTTLSVNITTTDALCGNNNGDATAIVNGGTTAYTYLWSNGTNSITATGLSIGTIEVTVTDANGCNGLASTFINNPTPFVTITDGAVLCNGDNNGTASAAASGGLAPYSFVWDNGQSTSTATGLGAGIYTVSVADGNGCLQQANATITEPTAISVTLSVTNTSCGGTSDGEISSTVTGGISPYSYSWSNGATSSSISALAANTFTVSITDANGCNLIDSETISSPSAITITAITTDVSCNNNGSDGSISVSSTGGTAPYNYMWNNGTSTANTTGLISGTYTITATDNNGCSTINNFIVNEPSIASITVSGGENKCINSENDTLEVTTTGGSWYGTAVTDPTLGIVSYSTSGTFVIGYTTTGYCATADSLTITVHGLPEITLDTTEVSCDGEMDGAIEATAIGDSPYTYDWSTGDNTPNANNLSIGIYEITITDVNGCSNADTVELINTNPCVEGHYFVPNIFSPNGDGENDVLYVYGDGIMEFTLNIFDRWGELVFQTTDLNFGWDGSHGGQPMNTDVFVYHLEVIYQATPGETTSEKGNITLIR